MSGVGQAIEQVRATYGAWRRHTPVEAMRADWDRLFADVAPTDVPLQPIAIGDLPAAWVVAPGVRDDAAILYLHGGGFRVGSTTSHHRIMADLSAATGVRVLGIDYRRAPEHLYPAAVEDSMAAWTWLSDTVGLVPDRVAIAGDSAGGNLALLTMLRLRDAGRALPAAALLMSAWTDLTASGDSFDTRAEADPVHSRAMILATAAGYLGDAEAADPAVSPLFADLAGLPPLLLQVGDRETVLSDSAAFVERARAAGSDAALSVWPGMIHVFQQFPDLLPPARQAIHEGADFLRRHLTEFAR